MHARLETVYAHVAQDASYFTGVAVINPHSQPAEVVVSVFESSGVQVGGGTRLILGNSRISEVLPQIDPELSAMSSGYFTVTSDRPVLGFAVFGTHSLSVLSAIPSQAALP